MTRILIASVALLLAVTGCGGSDADVSTTRPQRGGTNTLGLELFEERVVGANPGCVTCHSLEEGITLVGPSLFDVTSPVPAMTDADYIRQSIVDPDSYVVEGFVPGQMNPGWDEYLTEDQVESLVTLLLGS